MHRFGEVVLAQIQFVDTYEIKRRPALVLYEEQGNIIVAGITSNTKMKGVPLTKKEGALKNSVIKLNYVFSISKDMIAKTFFTVSEEKKELVKKEFLKRLNS